MEGYWNVLIPETELVRQSGNGAPEAKELDLRVLHGAYDLLCGAEVGGIPCKRDLLLLCQTRAVSRCDSGTF